MRELKFRAWDNKGKYWYPAETIKDFFNYLSEKFAIVADWLNKDAISLEQYTGLKDKNGKEIYEGDIVKIVSDPFPEPTVGIVGFDENRGVFDSYTIENNKVYWDTGGDFRSLMGRETYTTEVIGNIHENPELLEGEE